MRFPRLISTVLFSSCSVLIAAAQQPLAITFDDLPGASYPPPGETRLSVAQSVLKTLHEEKLPPVYGFVNADKVVKEPDAMRALEAWRAAGQPLGSHTYSHPDLETLSPAAFEQDIAKNEPSLQQLAGASDWHYFRFPYLHEGETLAKRQDVQTYLKQHGYKVAEVSLDFEDYLWLDPYRRCMSKHNEAAIVELERTYLSTADAYITVFHDLNQRLYGRQIPEVLLLHLGSFNARMLPRLLALLRQRGFTFASLQDVQSDAAYAHDPAAGVPTGGTLQELEASARKLKIKAPPKPYEALAAMCK